MIHQRKKIHNPTRHFGVYFPVTSALWNFPQWLNFNPNQIHGASKSEWFANFLCLTYGTSPYVYTARIMNEIRTLELIYERLIVKENFLIFGLFCTFEPYKVTIRLGPVNEFLISDLSNSSRIWEIYTYMVLERQKIHNSTRTCSVCVRVNAPPWGIWY